MLLNVYGNKFIILKNKNQLNKHLLLKALHINKK